MPPFVPPAVCAKCNLAMKPKLNGVDLQATIEDTGRSYYKVAADLWVCPKCKAEIYIGFGKPVERHDPRFDTIETEDLFYL